jgi:hypothetical protein
MGVLGGTIVSGALGGALAGGLATGSLTIGQKEHISKIARLASMLALSLVGYAIMTAVLIIGWRPAY